MRVSINILVSETSEDGKPSRQKTRRVFKVVASDIASSKNYDSPEGNKDDSLTGLIYRKAFFQDIKNFHAAELKVVFPFR